MNSIPRGGRGGRDLRWRLECRSRDRWGDRQRVFHGLDSGVNRRLQGARSAERGSRYKVCMNRLFGSCCVVVNVAETFDHGQSYCERYVIYGGQSGLEGTIEEEPVAKEIKAKDDHSSSDE